MTLAVDFDGVIHAYRHGWRDGTIYDQPVPGALDSLRTLLDHDAVFIHTSRQPSQVATWLANQGFTTTTNDQCPACTGTPVYPVCTPCQGTGRITFWNTRGTLLITNRKYPATAYLDDRAVHFTTWARALLTLLPHTQGETT